jgi:phage FluMu protein Com
MDEDPQKKPREDASKDEADVRCGCGSLLARRRDEGVEIKCRRCKRVLVIEVSWRGIRMSRERCGENDG